MIRGLYIGASGMLVELRRADLIANNLANVSTNGYKRDDLASLSFPDLLFRRYDDLSAGPGAGGAFPASIGRLGFGAVATESVVDWQAGTVSPTGNPLDLALSGEGFFTVETPNGVRYTRDGAFTRDSQGYLVTQNGYPVLGNRGRIQLGSGQVEIGLDGTVSLDGVETDRLKLVRFPKGEGLQKEGHNLFLAAGAQGEAVDARTTVHQGSLEQSNVNTVREMISLIASMRSYETNQRLIQVEDELTQKAVNEVGRA